jgi:excisionase family DNA binding protein
MSAPLTFELPAEAVEQIAVRAAELVAERSPNGSEPWIGVAEAAEHLGCTKSRVYSLISARRIPHEKDGSRVLFRRSVLDHWICEGGASCPR